MPKGPQGQKRKADVIGNAILIGRIATGEVEDSSKTKTVAEESGSKGGKARAAKLSKSQRSAIAKKASSGRWGREP
jgi:hypothetical protein